MTKEQLKRYLQDKREIERINERIQTVKHDLYELKAVPLSDMPKSSKGISNIEYLIDLKETLIQEYINKQTDCHIRMIQIEAAIMRLEDERYRDILSLRYLDGYTWEDIAERMKYDTRWVHRLHGRALQLIDHGKPLLTCDNMYHDKK